jgi:hypothetical protein
VNQEATVNRSDAVRTIIAELDAVPPGPATLPGAVQAYYEARRRLMEGHAQLIAWENNEVAPNPAHELEVDRSGYVAELEEVVRTQSQELLSLKNDRDNHMAEHEALRIDRDGLLTQRDELRLEVSLLEEEIARLKTAPPAPPADPAPPAEGSPT